LLGGGYAERACHVLEETGLLEVIAPEVSRYLDPGLRQRLGVAADDVLWADLKGLDAIFRERASEEPATDLQPVLFGTLLTPFVLHALQHGLTTLLPAVIGRGMGFA